MKVKFYLLALFVLSFVLNDWSQNEISTDMKSVIQLLNINLAQVDTELSIERPMRYIPEMMAFAIMEKENQLDSSEYEHFSYRCHVVLYNASDKAITQTYVIENLWSDAVRLSSLNFDFAPYLVKENMRAFGLRINYVGSSRPNPYGEEKITLFVIEKDKLVPILKDFTSYLYIGEWDTNCSGEFNEKRALFTIQTTQSMGFNTILVNYKHIKTVNTPAGNGDCNSKETLTKSSEVLAVKKGLYQLLK